MLFWGSIVKVVIVWILLCPVVTRSPYGSLCRAAQASEFVCKNESGRRNRDEQRDFLTNTTRVSSMRGRPFQPGNKYGRGRPRGSRNKLARVCQDTLDSH